MKVEIGFVTKDWTATVLWQRVPRIGERVDFAIEDRDTVAIRVVGKVVELTWLDDNTVMIELEQ